MKNFVIMNKGIDHASYQATLKLLIVLRRFNVLSRAGEYESTGGSGLPFVGLYIEAGTK